MLNQKLRLLSKYQAKVDQLQKEVARERASVLAHLHEEKGFASPKELIAAIRASIRMGGSPKAAVRKRRYAKIPEAVKQKIKQALEAKRPGSKIAKRFGISLPSVYNLKKAFGLVKASKKAAK